MPCYLKICKKFLKQAKMAVCSLSVLVTKSARSDFQMAAKPPRGTERDKLLCAWSSSNYAFAFMRHVCVNV